MVSLFADNHFVDDYARFSTLDTKEKSTAVANSMNYMTKKGKTVSCDSLSYKKQILNGRECFWSIFIVCSEDYLVSFKPKLPLHVFSFCPVLSSSCSSCYSCDFEMSLHQGWPPPTGMVITLFLRFIPSSHLLFFSVFCELHCWQCLDVFVNPPPLFHLCCISQGTQMTNYPWWWCIRVWVISTKKCV